MGNIGPAKYQAVDAIVQALAEYPLGATAKDVAAKLGWKRSVASSRLGRMWMYGIIDRVPLMRWPSAGREYRYNVRKVAANA